MVMACSLEGVLTGRVVVQRGRPGQPVDGGQQQVALGGGHPQSLVNGQIAIIIR